MRTIVGKIFNHSRSRIRLAFMNYFKSNQRHKPIGIKKLQDLVSAGVELLELNPPYMSTLHLDQKFLADCSPYIKPILTTSYPADYMAIIRNGRVFSYDSCNRAVISGDNFLIEEASLQWKDSMIEAKHNKIFSVKGFTNPKKYSGVVFSMLSIGAAKYYYYHWVFDTIPKLCLLKKSGMFKSVDYFLVPTYKFPYAKEYLEHFGITEDKIISEDTHHHIQADSLMVCSDIRINDHQPKWVGDFLFNSFFRNFLKGQKRNKLVYIARGDAARNRKLLNESALAELLQNFGFEIHFLSKISVLEQARLFNSAAVIVAVHGGGLANLVYCEPGTKLLEIFPDQYVRHYFYDLAQKRGVLYQYVLCESERQVSGLNEGEAVNLTADIQAVGRKVELLLAQKFENQFASSKADH
jgi:hypothetical protein